MPEWVKSFDEHLETVAKLDQVLALHLEPAVVMILEALLAGRKVLMCGNGGSCADASHFAAELSVRFETDRRALAAIALTDQAALTACANDYGYDHIFSRQVEAIGVAGDVLVAISTSGKSANVNEAVRRAKHLGLGTVGLSGARGIVAGADVDISVPSTSTARIQEAHALVIHLLCEELDRRLPKGEDPKWKQS